MQQYSEDSEDHAAAQAAQTENSSLRSKLMLLATELRSMGSVLVCYSGGIDSAFLLATASRELGEKAIGMIAVSPSLAPDELEHAQKLALNMGADCRLVESREIDDPAYVANGSDRCFHCKSELYRLAKAKSLEWDLAYIVNGTNCDDLGDYRPGLDAAKAAGVRSPLVAAGMAKSDVREGARAIGLAAWDKPASACLSSRIPYGTSVTRERLAQIAGFEHDLRELGFRQVRVRYHDKIARIELDIAELQRAVDPASRSSIVAAGQRNGFQYVTLDLGGYRTGSHNEVLIGNALRVL